MTIPYEEPGHCTVEPTLTGPSKCAVNYGTAPDGLSCTVANCTGVTIDCSVVPIKQLLKGAVVAPWVRLRFEGDDPPPGGQPDWSYTEITTGNVSMPFAAGSKCHAVIKSFQYGWGTISAGNVCKITIMDEEGGSFLSWYRRLIQQVDNASNPNNRGVYKMKVTWGWMITGADGCPDQYNDASAACEYTTIDPDPTPINASSFYSSNPNRIICSPPCWFLPDSISMSVQNGKIIYEIEGKDIMFRTVEGVMQNTFGDEAHRMHFTDAVEALGKNAQPPFNVDFLQVDESSGQLAPLEFWVAPGTPTRDPISNTPASLPTLHDIQVKGPLGVYKANGQNPLAIINSWILDNNVRSATTATGQEATGRGITMNYDSTANYANTEFLVGSAGVARGRLTLWADPHPNCLNADQLSLTNRLRALYIVNGGNCSSVYSFNPVVKWNFLAAARAGGVMTTTEGAVTTTQEQTSVRCPAPGTGPRVEAVAGNNARTILPEVAGPLSVQTAVLQRRANALHNTIEAELKVQGDPSLWLTSPIDGTGKTVAIIFIQPYFIDTVDGQSCPDWTVTSAGNCNSVFSNRNWFVRGVDHSIREGSYVTTLKVMLLAGAGELSTDNEGGVNPLGNDPAGNAFCGQGTFRCNVLWAGPDTTPFDYGPNTAKWSEFCESVNCSDGGGGVA